MTVQPWIVALPDASSTRQLGIRLGESLPSGIVLLLEGELGAGKTTLVQGIGEGLGIEAPIMSPTFTLINEYTEGRLPLYHLDLYRLQTNEIEAISPHLYWEGREVSPGITAIEWSQRLPYKPPHYLDIYLAYLPDRGRQATFSWTGQLPFAPETFAIR
jgi:tRNA threonylcarbamoyladenosine biosynthesis protein TsaE